MRRQLRVSLGQHSLVGAHDTNQDFFGACLPSGYALASKGVALAIADGISSSNVSQIASATAVRSFLEDYYATSELWTVRRSAQRVLAASNAWLHAHTMRGDGRFDKDRGYVCTFSALILKGRDVHMLHVGDSRIFRLHPQSLEQLSEDHRVWHASESYLARALGTGQSLEIDYCHWEASVGDIYLLATDGAYAHLDARVIHDMLARHPGDLDAAAAELVQHARDAGSDDDATLQILRIDELPDDDGAPVQLRRDTLSLPPVLTPGMEFEGFRIIRELQISARSHVHLAVDQLSGQQLVLKTPSIDLRHDPAYLDQFVFEEWVARRIDNPHIIKAWRGERPRNFLFVAMEFIDGQTLAQWMIDHPRPSLDQVRNIVVQLAKGLDSLHRREMLHRDIRPENVMIDRNGTVRIIDLATVHAAGLAEGCRSASAETAPGTLQYMAPECLLGEAPTDQADLFALAAMSYQMLCGQLPYGLDAARVRTQHDLRSLRYVPLRHHRPDLPAWLDSIFAQALHIAPHKRQQATSEFAHQLQAPAGEFRPQRSTPLIERDPVLFWKCSTTLLALSTTALLILRLMGK